MHITQTPDHPSDYIFYGGARLIFVSCQFGTEIFHISDDAWIFRKFVPQWFRHRLQLQDSVKNKDLPQPPPPATPSKVCTVLTRLPLTENYFIILLFPRGEFLWWCLFSSDPARWNRRSLRGFRNINPTCILHFVSAKRVKHRAVHKLHSFSGRTVCSGGIRIPWNMDGRYWRLSVRGRTDGRIIHRLPLYDYVNFRKPDLESSDVWIQYVRRRKHIAYALGSREWTLFSEIIFVVRIIQTEVQRMWRKYRDSDVILDITSLCLIAVHITLPKSASEHHEV